MASFIESYGFLSNMHGSALVSRDGSGVGIMGVWVRRDKPAWRRR
jgi:hypothetical protein